jgi:hypothetical protein
MSQLMTLLDGADETWLPNGFSLMLMLGKEGPSSYVMWIPEPKWQEFTPLGEMTYS